MKPNCWTFLCLGICCSSGFGTAFGHDRQVHRKITETAAKHALAASPAYAGFIQVVSPAFDDVAASGTLSDGSDFEDNKPPDEGGYRQLNHFYDPITGLGISNFPDDQATPPVGNNSFVWASTRDCPGMDIHLIILPVPIPIPVNANTYNKWSWQNARDYEWDALTSTDPVSRKEALTSTFRAIGQVMHLIQDASSPQHVRNEQHLAKKWLGLTLGWRSPIEIGLDKMSQAAQLANFSGGMLDWKAAGFTKMEDFWNRHLYNGNAAVLTAEANHGPKLGMAEWANGNFIGERHIYAEWMVTTHEERKPGWYPYPSRDTSTNYEQVKRGAGKKLLVLKDGTEVEGDYLSKIADGIKVTHHSRLKFLGAKQIKGVEKAAMCTINDDKVVQDYHSKIIPKAIEYTAGLLDYFFRGQLEATVIDVNNDDSLLLRIKNKSGQNLYGGAFCLFYDTLGGTRTELTGANFVTTWTSSSSLADNATITADFRLPEGVVVDKFTLVYKGSISGSTALDPIDAGIAIAAKQFKAGFPIGYWAYEGPDIDHEIDSVSDQVLEPIVPFSGSIAKATGKIGSAVRFEDGDFLVQVSGQMSYSGDGFSIAGWAFFDGTDPEELSGIIALSWDPDSGAGAHIIFSGPDHIHGDIYSEFDLISASITMGAGIPYNQWFFVCLTYDPADEKARLWVNGTTATSSGSMAVSPNYSSTAWAYAGGGVLNEAFFRTDEVAIFPFPLTSAQVSYLYNGGAGRTWPLTLP
jgi:hypothetical protein